MVPRNHGISRLWLWLSQNVTPRKALIPAERPGSRAAQINAHAYYVASERASGDVYITMMRRGRQLTNHRPARRGSTHH